MDSGLVGALDMTQAGKPRLDSPLLLTCDNDFVPPPLFNRQVRKANAHWPTFPRMPLPDDSFNTETVTQLFVLSGLSQGGTFMVSRNVSSCATQCVYYSNTSLISFPVT